MLSQLRGPDCRFAYSVETSDGEILDEVAIYPKAITPKLAGKQVYDMLYILSKRGYLNRELKWSSKEGPSGRSFSKIFTINTEPLAGDSIPEVIPNTSIPSDSKNAKKSSINDSGQKNAGSVGSKSVNSTPTNVGLERSISYSSSLGNLGDSDSIDREILCDNSIYSYDRPE